MPCDTLVGTVFLTPRFTPERMRAISIRFYLKRPKEKQTSIFATITGYGKVLKIYLPVKIESKYWDLRTQRPRNLSRVPRLERLRVYLSEFESAVIDFIESKSPSRERLTAFVKDWIREDEKPSERTTDGLLGFIRKTIEQSGAVKARRTIQQYERLENKLIDFSKVYPRTIDFDTIDDHFYYAFIDWLKSLGLMPNTVGTYIQLVKTFMNSSFDRGLHQNQKHRARYFKSYAEKRKSVYLTEKEIQAIADLNLTGMLLNAQQLFLLGCYTGLRYSDFTGLDRINIQDGILSIKMAKTGGLVYVPIKPQAKKILESLDKLHTISNQKINSYIKQIAEKAGITDLIRIEKTIGFDHVVEERPKYELVTSHTARRSFATNALIANVPIDIIRDVLGHSNIETTENYIGISKEQRIKQMVDHPFFS